MNDLQDIPSVKRNRLIILTQLVQICRRLHKLRHFRKSFVGNHLLCCFAVIFNPSSESTADGEQAKGNFPGTASTASTYFELRFELLLCDNWLESCFSTSSIVFLLFRIILLCAMIRSAYSAEDMASRFGGSRSSRLSGGNRSHGVFSGSSRFDLKFIIFRSTTTTSPASQSRSEL